MPKRSKYPRLRLAALAVCFSTSSCGGGGVSYVQAQVVPPVEVAQFHFILRPDAAGRWYIQNNVDHASTGVMPQIEQGADYLRVFFDRSYTHAGVIQVTSDDDFRNLVSGYSNLGLNNATIRIVAGGVIIDPATVYNYLPVGGGNLWCSVTMLNKP